MSYRDVIYCNIFTIFSVEDSMEKLIYNGCIIVSMLINKRLQFAKIFSQAILDMKDTGRFDIFQGEMSRHKDQSCKIPDPKETPLGYKKLVFLFAVLALGIVMSLFIAFYEFFERKYP